MKSFVQIREGSKGNMPGEALFTGKVNGYKIMIHKDNNKYVAYIDSEKLDSYGSMNDAKKAATQFIKMAGGK